MRKQYQKEIEKILEGTDTTATSQIEDTATGIESEENLSNFMKIRRLLKPFLAVSLGLLILALVGKIFLPDIVVTVLIITATLLFLITYCALFVTFTTKTTEV